MELNSLNNNHEDILKKYITIMQKKVYQNTKNIKAKK